MQEGVKVGIQAPEELKPLVMKIEQSIKRKISVGRKISHQKLADDLTKRFDNLRAVQYAIINLIRRGEFQHV